MLINIRTNRFGLLYDIQSKNKSQLSKAHITIAPSQYQVTKNLANGKKERVFVDLQAVYPSPEEPGTELSFEEIWAANRGWLDQTWEDSVVDDSRASIPPVTSASRPAVHHGIVALDENGHIPDHHRDGRGRKKKVTEVNETQISKASFLVHAVAPTTNSQQSKQS